MSDENQLYQAKLWEKRRNISFVFILIALYILAVLTIPYFSAAGTGLESSFFKLGFFLPIISIIFSISCFVKTSPVYKTTKEDIPLILLFGIVLILVPLYANLDEIQQIKIKESIWPIAWISSSFLGVLSGYIFFTILRKNYILLGAPIIFGLFATSIGSLFGIILFKIISLFIGE